MLIAAAMICALIVYARLERQEEVEWQIVMDEAPRRMEVEK